MTPEQVIAHYKHDGYKTYAVVMNVIGVENNLLLLSPGNTKGEALESAIETLCMLKSNDMEAVSIIEVVQEAKSNET